MSLDDALAAVTFAYKSDAAFVASPAAVIAGRSVVFPGDPSATETVDLNEQQSEWPAFVLYPTSGYERLLTHGSSTSLAVYTVRLAIETPRDDQDLAWRELMAVRPHVRRVFWAGWHGRFAGTVAFLGDPSLGGGTPPFRWEVVESEWGGIQTFRLAHEFTVSIEEALA
jgi:hypothetical protein